jgi:hypothetical protein
MKQTVREGIHPVPSTKCRSLLFFLKRKLHSLFHGRRYIIIHQTSYKTREGIIPNDWNIMSRSRVKPQRANSCAQRLQERGTEKTPCETKCNSNKLRISLNTTPPADWSKAEEQMADTKFAASVSTITCVYQHPLLHEVQQHTLQLLQIGHRGQPVTCLSLPEPHSHCYLWW